MQKILINLPNGDQLAAEECVYDGGQIAIGIVRDGSWVQDLVVVETKNDEGKYVEDKYDIYLYEDEYDECYTNKVEVNRAPSNAL